MRLVDVSISHINDRVRLTGVVVGADKAEPVELFFEYPRACEPWLSATADAFLPALLVPAMMHGDDIQLDVPICDDVINWAVSIQDLYTNWYPEIMQRVNVDAPQRQPMRDAQLDNIAAFFSMGVDSFYTLLKNMRGKPSPAGPISHLLYVEGLDTPLNAVENADDTRTAMAEVAKAAGKKLIIGATNLRDQFPIDYGMYYSGPCLSAVALSLAPGLKQALIASTTDYRGMYPAASHVLVEGSVRAGHFRVVHDGGERNRLERITQMVGSDPLSQKYLRVCTQNRSGMHNCGKCQKCLRTMASLHLLGTLEKVKTFSREFNASTVRQMCIRNEWDEHYLKQILEYAQQSNTDPQVTGEFCRLFSTHHRRNRWQRTFEDTPLHFVVPLLDKSRRRAREYRSRWRQSRATINTQQNRDQKQHATANDRLEKMNEAMLKTVGKPGQTRRVTVAGSFGFGNAGDEGAPLALQDMARSIGVELDVDILGRFDEPEDDGVIGLGDRDAALRAQLTGQPVLYIGGGIVEPDRKASVSRIGAWARQSNIPYAALFGAAVEPRVRYGWCNRRRLITDLNQLKRLYVRDVVSAVELSRLMPSADIQTIGDVMLWLQPGEKPTELAGIERYIAVNLAPRWSDEPGWRQWITKELCRLAAQQKVAIVFVPCTQKHDRDQDEHDVVARLLAEAGCDQPVICLQGDYTPREIAAAFGGAELTIGMRLHACVLSYAQQVPWVGLAYHPKLSAFAATVQQPSRLLPQHIPAKQSAEVYGFSYSSLKLADCDLVQAANDALEDSSFHQLQPLRESLAQALRLVLDESSRIAVPARLEDR